MTDGFTPPKNVRAQAKRGLELRKKFGRGGTMVGVARAKNLMNGDSLPIETIGRMVSYFARHEVDKQGEGWGVDSAGYIAWLLWGGDAGRSWANAIWKEHQEKKMAKSLESVKAGARHNAKDMALLKELGRTAKQFNTLLVELGLDEDELEPEETSEDEEDDDTSEEEAEVEIEETNPTTKVPVGTEVIEGKAMADVEAVKAVSLEERAENVRSMFYKTFRAGGYDYPDRESLWITGVYDGYVVVKCGICYHKVSYTQNMEAITFTPRDQWEKVETEWVTKSIDIDTLAMSVKSVGEDRLGMYLVLWGDENKRDVQREWFTPETQDMLDVFKAVGKIPTMYHHGMDKNVKSEVVGIFDVMVPDDIGIWAETQLNANSKYKAAIKKLASLGALGSSSGAAPATRKVKSSGEIERWTIMEGSLTPSPVEYRQATEIPVTVLKSIYSEIGLDFPYEEDHESGGVEKTQKADDLEKEIELSRMSLELVKMKMEVNS